MTQKIGKRFSPELRERAVRMVQDREREGGMQWESVGAIAAVALQNLDDQDNSPPGRALTTAELRRHKPDRHAFRARARLPVQVVLDGVRQGYNVGALFRLCDAFLCERLVVCGRDATRGMRKLVQAGLFNAAGSTVLSPLRHTCDAK